MSKPETDLVGIDLEELSLVDEPANQQAKITLLKGRTQMTDAEKKKMEGMSEDERKMMQRFMGKGMPFAEAEKMMAEERDKMRDMKKQVTDLEAELDELTKRAEAAEAREDQIAKAAKAAGFEIARNGDNVKVTKSEVEYVEFQGKMIAKGSVPNELFSVVKGLSESLAEHKESTRLTNLAKRAESEIPNLAGSELTKARLLDAVDSLGAEADDVLKILKAADAAMLKAFEEKGQTGADDLSDDQVKLDKMLEAHIAANPTLSKHQALADVTKSGEGLRLSKAIRQEQRGRQATPQQAGR